MRTESLTKMLIEEILKLIFHYPIDFMKTLAKSKLLHYRLTQKSLPKIFLFWSPASTPENTSLLLPPFPLQNLQWQN